MGLIGVLKGPLNKKKVGAWKVVSPSAETSRKMTPCTVRSARKQRPDTQESE